VGLILIVVAMVLLWLLLVRPQERRARLQRDVLAAVDVGDEIVSTGGLYGTVRAADGDELQVEIAEGLVVRMARAAVAAVVEPDLGLEDDEERDGSVEPAVESAPPSYSPRSP
jgi:preprotein translocase subunit YajC